MKKRIQVSLDEAKRVGDCLYVDWDQVDLDEFRQGLMGKRRLGNPGRTAGLAYDGVLASGKTVMTHMRQIPDYVIRLAKLRAEVRQVEEGRRLQQPDGAVLLEAAVEAVEPPRI